ncbi:aldose 1-epimerase [Streptomyces sp. NPDC000410]|uniref:aldose epimerase family protein n=1 Tax=Streptomyces sp. NPDC000410 TaxID=3154254 RepID=UPI003324BF80
MSSEECVRLAAGDVELTVDPAGGCRITSLRIAGTELLRQGERYGCFPMVPWCGRTAGGRFSNGGVAHQLPLNSPPHAIHGTGRDTSWRTARTGPAEAAFTYELGEPWPYRGLVTQTFELTEDSLTLQLGIETYDVSFPAQAGWHPWFLRHAFPGEKEALIDFTPDWQEERGPDHIPTGRGIDLMHGPWDDCFGMPDGVDVTLTWPDRLELTVKSREEWVVIYDEQEEAICVEPQSGPPNGLNTHPRLVTPIDPLEVAATWTWRRLDRA